MYEKINPLVVHWMQNGGKFCFLAYGQTGSGKSHTCGTELVGDVEADWGILDRLLDQVYELNFSLHLNLTFDVTIDEISKNVKTKLMDTVTFGSLHTLKQVKITIKKAIKNRKTSLAKET